MIIDRFLCKANQYKDKWNYGYTELGSYGYTVYGLLFTVYSLQFTAVLIGFFRAKLGVLFLALRRCSGEQARSLVYGLKAG